MKYTYVFPEGNTNAKIALVGEQPGIYEVAQGKLFVGPSGQSLNHCLQLAGIIRSEIYLTNVIKDLDKPISSYINLNTKGKFSFSEEGKSYLQELKEELSRLDINIAIACGNIPLIALCGRSGITKWRGSLISSTLIPNLKIIPTFHPATTIPPKNNFLNKPLIVNDLIEAKKESKFKEIKKIKRNITIKPTFIQTIQTLEKIYSFGLQGKVIDIDIEVINLELDCIAFAWDPTNSFCVPFRCSKGDYFNIEQEYQVMKIISKIMQDKRVAMAGASFIFDTQFMLTKYGIIPRGNLHCTHIAQKIITPDYPAGLDFATNMNTDICYYKQDGKQWMKKGLGTWETWWNYNGMDTIATAASREKQINILSRQENLKTYERQKDIIKPLIYMSEKGIKIDLEGLKNLKLEEEKRLKLLVKEFKAEVGYEINQNSPKQLGEYFYEHLKINPYKKRKSNGEFSVTTDVNALKRISRKGIKAATILLEIRRISKRISTYLKENKISPDGRIHSAFKPVGTSTGRISSGKTIFGLGGNIQNIPHDILKFFVFDKNYIGYSFDLSQVENRIVAYVGGVSSQIEAFNDHIDLHTLTASIIFKKSYYEVSKKDGSSSLGTGSQSERFWGKKCNHSYNYGLSYKTFALTNEITEKDAKGIFELLHKGYPQIVNGYQKTIEHQLKKNRTIENLMGRKRIFMGIIHPSKFSPISGCKNTFREAYAHFPQSSTADKINEQGISFIYNNQKDFAPVELLSQVHDSIVFQIPLSISFEEHSKMLFKIKKSLEKPFYWKGLEIKIPVNLEIGLNMSSHCMIKIPGDEITDDYKKLGKKITSIHNRLINEDF